ncbi:UNVERIFIED_CONTAM: hypothetical protein FKN15_049294 [Acipenser sinensis]
MGTAQPPSPMGFLGYTFEESHMRVHTILIIIIFCIVCFLLLVAFFYAFCFHCSTASVPKDSRGKCNLDREDATFRRSSSPSVVNSI